MLGCWRKSINSLERDFQGALNEIEKDPIMSLKLDSVKAIYGTKFYDLRTIINKYDPIGLIRMGAPENEYDSEVKTIIVQLDKTENEKDILDLVYSEFERWFGNAGKKENYRKLSTEIYDCIKNK